MDADLDLDEYGIGWWELPTWQRILISHQLIEAVGDVCKNLLEAKVHHSSWLDRRETEREQLRYKPMAGGFTVPRHGDSPDDDLSGAVLSAHMTGFFRAIGSTLDCLGATIIGVAGLPTDLRYGDWKSAGKALPKVPDVEERVQVDTAIHEPGPPGWDEWAVGMRNMQVHRPRRMHFTYIRPIYESGPKTVEYLPRVPLRSEVEAVLDAGGPRGQLLHEDAADTLGGILQSTVYTVEVLSGRLLELWRDRRADPSWIAQSPKQWPKWNPPTAPGFEGYTKRGPTITNRPGMQLMLSEKTGRRLSASALTDDAKQKWRRFLPDDAERP